MTHPYFSIVIPCYNHGKYLQECIGSVAAQNFNDYEVIIVNDGSTDNSLAIAENLASGHTNISVLDKANGGLSSARNAGMTVAVGEYLQFLDADDVIYPDALQQVFEAVKGNDAPELIQTGYAYFKDNPLQTFQNVRPNKQKTLYPTALEQNIGPCHSVFIKRASLLLLGEFDESLRSAEDWDMWMRAAKADFRVAMVSDFCVGYRYVADSMSRNPQVMYEAMKTVAMRAVSKDNRIKISATNNIDLEEYDLKKPIKRLLITCLGVQVMKEELEAASELYSKEKKAFQLTIEVEDFKHMYSYLTFRYWSSKGEVNLIIDKMLPLYQSFFQKIDLSKSQTKVAISAIFIPIYKIRNRLNFGNHLGGALNYFKVFF